MSFPSSAAPDFSPDGFEGAAYRVTPSAGGDTALVFASPHSGADYPADMGAAPGLTARSLRSAEDALMHELAAPGPRHGAPLLAARIGRAYVDLNRPPRGLDPALIDDAAAGESGPDAADPKTAAGYGVIPRLAGDGTPLYARRLSRAEAEDRLARVHAPYHAALQALMEAARARHGRAVLVDWHSMPARAGGVEVVLGDRHGASCRPRLTRRLRELFEGLGWRVGLNHPYAGGWCTQAWGRPDAGFEAIQVEISRGLYWNAEALAPSAGHRRCRRGIEQVIAKLCAENWT